MKKVIAVILALVLALSTSVIAFADDTAVQCPYCGLTFASTEAYNQHKDAHKCPVCGNICLTSQAYNDCINSHRNADYYLVCKTCGKEYLNVENYVACERGHIGPQDSIYVCETCNAKFSDESSYSAHVATHYNNVNYHWKEYIGLTLPQLLDQFVQYFKSSGLESALIDMAYQLFNLALSFIQGNASEADVAGAADKLDSAISGANISSDIIAAIKDFITAIKQKIKSFYAGEAETVVEVTDAEAPVETGSATAGIAAFAVISAAAAAAYVCSKKKA